MSSIPKKSIKRKKSNRKPNSISTSKLVLILLGTVFILFGILIGDIRIDSTKIPYYYLIILGLLFQGFCVALFIKENTVKPT